MSGNDWQAEVENFMEVMGQAISEKPGCWADDRRKNLCEKLVKEEYEEWMQALECDDVVELIDASIDLIYVLLYSLSSIGIQADPYFEEVQRTNMAKVGGPKDPVTGKQLKPEGWTPPRILELLNSDRMLHALPKYESNKK